MTSEAVNLWSNSDHARSYLERSARKPWREVAYDQLVEILPPAPRRVLDLGCGDGEVMSRGLAARPGAEGVACDFSAEMLGRARARFASTDTVTVIEHDLDAAIPKRWGTFDLVVSAFAIHHVVDERKRALYREIFEMLEPGGVFCNLEHVASATPELHEVFLRVIGADEDPSNKLVEVEPQLGWLRDLGFEQVECFYKWREIALLAGVKP
jgi:ubiquinone/menaquinone biosynthesis C-methylase UbiE